MPNSRQYCAKTEVSTYVELIWRALNNPVPTLYGLIVVLLTFLVVFYIPLRFF